MAEKTIQQLKGEQMVSSTRIIDPRRRELRKALKDKGYYIHSSYKDPRAGNEFRHKIEVTAVDRQGPRGGLFPEQGKEMESIVTSIIPEAFCKITWWDVRCTWTSAGKRD